MTACPTCGQPVRVHQSSDGTGCFVPEPSVDLMRNVFEETYCGELPMDRGEGDSYYLMGVDAEWIAWQRCWKACVKAMQAVPEPSEEKIRAAFEAATEFAYLDKDTAGDYLDSDVWRDWVKFKSAYLAGWKDRGGG